MDNTVGSSFFPLPQFTTNNNISNIQPVPSYGQYEVENANNVTI